MKIKITFDLDDNARRGIAHHYGDKGLAGYEDCKNYITNQVETDLQDIASEVSREGGSPNEQEAG